MREPKRVLNELTKQSRKEGYHYQRLYRNLYNPEFYLLAYQNIYANQGSLTRGADTITLDGISQMRIDQVIRSVKDHSYQPQPARRTYIAKKNSDKKRPLGISSGNDKLIQEIIKMILESIYEPIFHEKIARIQTRKELSHGAHAGKEYFYRGKMVHRRGYKSLLRQF